jgi:hypothetical protein
MSLVLGWSMPDTPSFKLVYYAVMALVDVADGISDVALGASMISDEHNDQGISLVCISIACAVLNIAARRWQYTDGSTPGNTFFSMVAFLVEVGTAAACMYSVFEEELDNGIDVSSSDNVFVTISVITTMITGCLLLLQMVFVNCKRMCCVNDSDSQVAAGLAMTVLIVLGPILGVLMYATFELANVDVEAEDGYLYDDVSIAPRMIQGMTGAAGVFLFFGVCCRCCPSDES